MHPLRSAHRFAHRPLVLLLGLLAACGEATPVSETTPVGPAVTHATAQAPSIPHGATRLVLVRTADWTTPNGALALFHRDGDSAWVADGGAHPVVVGRSGLGWGRGLHGDGAPAGRDGPVKAEGDGRAPAGVFALGATYGYDATAPAGATAPYTQLTESWQCVDDGASPRYNTMLDTSGLSITWSSHEVMRRTDELYRRVVFVEHNTGPAVAGGGSCIFLHVWRGQGQGTAGCTAMPLPDLERLVTTIDPGHTVMVALPDVEVRALREAWNLPAMPEATGVIAPG